ncbi:Metallo-dependent phosphatase [Hypoxylon crocopeplum]|nr:Metallo-dependent phosphatase [Hypoxylon crocopeplum]
MGRHELLPRPQAQWRQRRRILATGGTIFTILIIVLLSYTRFDKPSFQSLPKFQFPERPDLPSSSPEESKMQPEQAEETMAQDTASHPPLTNPTLLISLPPSVLPKPGGGPDSHRLIVIGDVHGQLEALNALLAKVGYSGARGDEVIFTGDMINKGPNSAGVVDRAMAIGARGVRGNHEDRVLRAWARAQKNKKKSKKTKHGRNSAVEVDGREQEQEVEVAVEEEQEEEEDVEAQHLSKSERADRATAASLTRAQLSWLAALPVILRIGAVSPYYGDVVVVHAGLVPGIPLKKQDAWAAMNMRTLISPFFSDSSPPPSDAHLDSLRKSPHLTPSEGREGRPWASLWNALQKELHRRGDSPTTAVYGHDAKVGLSVRRYAFGLDSSCVKGGDLTALVFEPASTTTSTTSSSSKERDDNNGDEEGDMIEERLRHGITHRLVSVSCEAAAVSDDDKGGKSKDKDKSKGKDKDRKKEKGKREDL